MQQHYLKALAGKRVLIILDNAKDEQQVKELLAVPPPVGFIVTSRETLLHLDGVKRINLDMLAVEESLELLRGIVGERGSEDELRTVAGLCGQLPLALRVAGSFLSIEDGRSVKEYIRALEEEGDRLRPLKGPAEKDVEAVLRLSAQQLVRENRKLAEWWQMLSVFPASFDRRAAAAVCGMRTANAPGTDEILRDAVAEDPSPDGPYLGTLDTTAALDALRELTRRSLVQYVATAGRYELHDLMRPVARTAFISSDGQTAGIEPSDCIRSAEFRLALYFGALLSRVGTAQMDGAGSPPDPDRLLKQEAANIRAGWTWAKGHRSSPDYESVARILCHNYAFPKFQFVHSVLSTDEQIDWFTVSAEVCDLLKDSGCESVARRNLGLALAEAGRSEHAIFSLKRALEIAYKYDNWDLVYEAVVALMKTNIARGAFEKALSCYQKYLGWEVRKQRFRCHPDIFFLTMGGLSMTPFIKEPQLPPESRFPFIKLAFDTYKGNLDAAQLSMNRKAEGVAYHNLGLTQWFASEYSSAIIFLSTACSIAQQLKDVDWERILCSSLSMCMSICGLKREAISKAEQALMLSKSIDSGKHERSHQIWLETLKNDEAWL